MKKFYVVGFDQAVSRTWRDIYGMQPSLYQDADLVIFTGGSDVGAKYYNKETHHTMYVNPARDEYEVNMMRQSFRDNKKIFGICRGAQLGHILMGGDMYQDVDHHAIGGQTHWSLDLQSGEAVRTSSCHHQMMIFDRTLGGQLVTTAARSTYRDNTTEELVAPDGERFKDDTEVIWYPEVNLLCYQGHPEYQQAACTRYAGQLQRRFNLID